MSSVASLAARLASSHVMRVGLHFTFAAARSAAAGGDGGDEGAPFSSGATTPMKHASSSASSLTQLWCLSNSAVPSRPAVDMRMSTPPGWYGRYDVRLYTLPRMIVQKSSRVLCLRISGVGHARQLASSSGSALPTPPVRSASIESFCQCSRLKPGSSEGRRAFSMVCDVLLLRRGSEAGFVHGFQQRRELIREPRTRFRLESCALATRKSVIDACRASLPADRATQQR